MRRVSGIILILIFISILLMGCALQIRGELCPSRDPDFWGCFCIGSDTRNNFIHITQEECNQLNGTGEGIFVDAGWSFSGEVKAIRYAELNIETEMGVSYNNVTAERLLPDPPGGLTLRMPDSSLYTLYRCPCF